MLTSTQVQQATVALFGASAGGHTARLVDTYDSVSSLVAALAQSTIYAETYPAGTSNLALANALVANLIPGASDEAVEFATDWIVGSLAVRSLGETLEIAVRYLAGPGLENEVMADAAASFNARVEGAETFAAENADVTDLAALQGAVDETVFRLNLTAALEAKTAADEAVAQALVDALDNETVYAAAEADAETTTADGNDITAALEDAVEGVDAQIGEGEDTAFAEATDNGRVAVLANERATMEATTADAQEALDAAVAAIADIEDLADAFADYDAAVAAQDAADTAETRAENALTAAALQFDLDAGTGEGAFGYEDAEGDAEGAFDTLVSVTWDSDGAEGEAAEAVDIITVAEDVAAASEDAEDLIAAETIDAADLDALIAKVQAAIDADEASVAADTAVEDAGAAFEAFDAEIAAIADAEDDSLGGAETAEVAYAIVYGAEGLEVDLETAEEDQADFEEAVAAYKAMVALSDAYDDLVEAQTAANDAITNGAEDDPVGLGVSLIVIEAEAEATDADDAFVYSSDAGDITDFGAEGTDSIYFGTDYALVALGAEEAIEDAVGDASALEIFWMQDGEDTVLYVEEETFGGNSTTTGDIVEITLNGVDAADIVYANGYLQVVGG